MGGDLGWDKFDRKNRVSSNLRQSFDFEQLEGDTISGGGGERNIFSFQIKF